MCALQLAPAIRVTLVDPAGHFTERIPLTPGRLAPGQILTGRPAAAVKEQIVRSTVGALRLAVRHPGAAARIVGAS